MEFVKANIPVFSNAKNYRKDPLVPLVVPTVNLPHLDLIPHQRSVHGLDRGFLVCNSNCAVIGLVIPFAALQARFGPIATVSIVTMQAVSGAGYPGVSSMDVIDNVVPFIQGEEDKLESEARKILGSLDASGTAFVEQEGLRVSAACNRVPVMDGHTACVSLSFARRPAPSAEEVKEALRAYTTEAQSLGCPSAPEPAIAVFDEDDRPQPRLDRDLGNGYTVSVGRVREDEAGIFDVKFVALSHNSKYTSSQMQVSSADINDSRHWSRRVVDTERRGSRSERVHLDRQNLTSKSRLDIGDRRTKSAIQTPVQAFHISSPGYNPQLSKVLVITFFTFNSYSMHRRQYTPELERKQRIPLRMSC